jgi:hypothetical protein
MDQYSLENNKKVDMKIDSNLYPLAKGKEQMNGRFFLYPTTNIYNFMLLDQVDGRVWQVQWSFEEDKRFLTRISSDTKLWSVSDSVKIGDLEYRDYVYYKNGELFNGENEEETWHARKQAAIDRLAAAPRDAKIVAIGDKLSNMRAIARDYKLKGDALWNIFHVKDKASHEWHYRGLAASLSELSDTFAYQEFVKLIEDVFSGSRDSGITV